MVCAAECLPRLQCRLSADMSAPLGHEPTCFEKRNSHNHTPHSRAHSRPASEQCATQQHIRKHTVFTLDPVHTMHCSMQTITTHPNVISLMSMIMVGHAWPWPVFCASATVVAVLLVLCLKLLDQILSSIGAVSLRSLYSHNSGVCIHVRDAHREASDHLHVKA